MKKILRFLHPIVRYNYTHPFWIVGVSLVIAFSAAYFATRLKIETDIANLLPDSNEYVQALERLKETVGGDTPMEVAIKSPSFEDNKRFARDLIESTMDLHYKEEDIPYFERYEFEKDTKILKENALYFATPSELEEVESFLREKVENAKLEANPFYVNLEEEQDTADGEKQIERFNRTYNSLIPKRYPVNEDSTIMVLRFYPTGSSNDISYLSDMFARYDSLIQSMNPESYNEQMKVVAGGRLKRHLNEFQSIIHDVKNSFASGLTGVILLVMFYFSIKKYLNYRKADRQDQNHGFWEHLIRMPVPVLVIGIPLLISLFITFGITYFALGSLNTMTSVLFVILFGLGIDYGIHFYARYIEFRSEGYSIYDAIETTYYKTGSAIVTSALTTAAALYVLIIAEFRGFSEFGFISGTGIIFALLVMLFVLPALLVIFEKFNWILLLPRSKGNKRDFRRRRFPLARSIVIIGVVVTALVIINNNQLSFQYKFGELEPEYQEYERFREISSKVFPEHKRNAAYIVANSDRQVLKILEKLRTRMKKDTTSPTIEEVEALQERFPTTDSAVNSKLQKIAEIRDLLQSPYLKDEKGEQLSRLRNAAQTTDPLDIDNIPDYLKRRFVTKSGEIGKFVIVYPGVGLSDGRKSIAFKEDVGRIELSNGKTFYAAGTSIVAAEMLQLMRKESPWMVTATLLLVFIFMLLAFRSLRWAVIALIPLMVGLIMTFGVMIVLGMQFNFYNLIVLPAILGIGEDNGVHLANRYLEEGKKSMSQVLSSTGQHITVGSLTTMLGFAGLLFTNHPGLRSIGQLAVLGIGMTLVTGLLYLPAIIQWLENKEMLHFRNKEKHTD